MPSLAFAISVASLLMSRHAWTIAEEAKGKARHSLRVSVYSVEVNRKRLGIPYDHDVVEQYEANEGIFASMGVGSYKGRRCKDSDGIVQSDDAVQVFSDGTYRIVPRTESFSVLKPVFCRVMEPAMTLPVPMPSPQSFQGSALPWFYSQDRELSISTPAQTSWR